MLEKLKPAKVFSIFEDLCRIPHGSGNMEKISRYCEQFAAERGLWCCRDALHNIIIKKPAFAGYESHPPVILQGHLDMVCEKEADCDIDFLHDPLRLNTDGEFIWAEGTTLGGDDGIAVAMILSVLDSDTLPHPPIEAVFTVDEETGMYGAKGLDCSLLSGRTLINIDSEDEGVLTAGCAGGARVEITLPLKRAPLEKDCVKISVGGLMGGHSGAEIDKGRLNADKILGGLLSRLDGLRIVDLHGGLKDNAIPAAAECIAYCDSDAAAIAAAYQNEAATATDPGLSITVTACGAFSHAYTAETSRTAAELLSALPNGIIAMSSDIPELVETSLNLGILYIKDDTLCASFAVRSSKNARKSALCDSLKSIAGRYGAGYSSHGHYPAWEFRQNSRLRGIMSDTFLSLYGRSPTVAIIHAGLECGLFSDKIPGLDAVSFGPDMRDIHTPRERLSVASAERTYRYLCEILKNL